MSILFIDGVKFKLWAPHDEEKDFHPLIRKCFKEIFGEDSLYFDVKHTLKSASGIGSIPDAYVINLSKRELYIVENELSSHPVYDHIVKQLTKFINGIENLETKMQIVNMLYDEVNRDIVLRAIIQKAIGSTDIHHFLSKLLSKPPNIVIIVDLKTKEIEEACKVLKYQPKIVEFKTYIREDSPNVKAHLFEPLPYVEETREIKKTGRLSEDELRKIAEDNGVGGLFTLLVNALSPFFDGKGTTLNSVYFSGLQEGKINTIFHIVPVESSQQNGLKFRTYSKRFAKYFNILEREVETLLPSNIKEWKPSKNQEYFGYEGFFKNKEEIQVFLNKLQKLKNK